MIRIQLPLTISIDDAFDRLTGITKRLASLTCPNRQQILDQRPLGIRQQLKSRRNLSLTRNSQILCQTHLEQVGMEADSRPKASGCNRTWVAGGG